MRVKKTVKKIIDAAMLLLMPVLAAEIQLGQESHEWLGTVMFGLFILHHVMNYKWITGVFKGTYSPVRAFVTALNFLLLMDFIALAYSGPKMSGFVFRGLPLPGSMMTARTLHLFASEWSFILISLHTGVHSGLHKAKTKAAVGTDTVDAASQVVLTVSAAKNGAKEILPWLIRGVVCALSIFGLYAFIDLKMPDYLFLQTHFMFYDETKSLALYFAEIICMMVFFGTIGHMAICLLKKIKVNDMGKKVAKIIAFLIPVLVCLAVIFALNSDSFNGGKGNGGQTPWGNGGQAQTENGYAQGNSESVQSGDGKQTAQSGAESAQNPNGNQPTQTGGDSMPPAMISDGLLLIKGGTFEMGSPDSENWRGDDEAQHTVTVDDFYMSAYELTQKEYARIMGNNPSNFDGDNLPVENITWLDAVSFCNTLSEKCGLTPVYTVEGNAVTWDRSANGYRLPTEAEWEYACRAGTVTPFNTEKIPGADSCNFYGHYPYQIEQNYFTQNKLETKPGEYRQTTVPVDSFEPSGWGLYNMHGNVSEWVWDYYGEYDVTKNQNPTGAPNGNLRVYRGGGWNDFGKNTRSAYRGTMAQNMASFNVGMRLVRNAVTEDGMVSSEDTRGTASDGGKVLIAFFSWGGNTRGIARQIQAKTGADLFEIELVHPYSSDYNTVLDEAQHDQNIQARPEIANKIENFDDYDIILIGYPNWWASIPMPIASLLEEYDFSGKTIIPFCSHGGGRFGQSITAISKLAPDSVIGEGLSVHYSGGASLGDDIDEWIERNKIRHSE